MAKILYGSPVKEEIKKRLIERVKKLGRKPTLAVLQVGDREDSNIYIKQKQKFAEEIGIETIIKKFKIEGLKDLGKSEDKLIREIERLNKDEKTDGIIVQLPLPQGFAIKKILNLVSKKKDADGLVSGSGIMPATARGVIALLDYYKISVTGKKAAVIGQGILAGKPISDELEKKGAEVFRCDINTKNIPAIAKKCGLLISAVGQAGLITEEFINPDQVVIDVGVSRVGGKVMGDADFSKIEPKIKAITPTPGGAGPLTVTCLFENLVDLCYYNS